METSTPSYKVISAQGLWQNNPGIVQLLGLCPLLAVTTSAVNGLGLGIATMLVLIMTNFLVSMCRRFTPEECRLPIFVLVIASLVTISELTLHAYFPSLYVGLGIFLALIATNCTIIGRAEAFASKQPILPSIVDGFMQGLGFMWVLVLLGSIREIIGHGTWLANIDQLFGASVSTWTISLKSHYSGFLLAILTPGAFITLGLILAFKNWLNQK